MSQIFLLEHSSCTAAPLEPLGAWTSAMGVADQLVRFVRDQIGYSTLTSSERYQWDRILAHVQGDLLSKGMAEVLVSEERYVVNTLACDEDLGP